MPTTYVAVLLLLALPILLLALHRGWLSRRRAFHDRTRAALVLGVAAVLVWAMPRAGATFEDLKRIDLLLTTATVGLLLLHRRKPFPAPSLDAALAVLALLAVANHYNYGSFRGHGVRAWVHLHDVAHYYLGAKYSPELGYTDLYTALLRAEAEDRGGRLAAPEARDLGSYRLLPSAAMVAASDPVKAAFSAERWFDFRRDVRYFRERLGEHYPRLLLDHGFNPTPVWVLLGYPLTSVVPAGSAAGILSLTLLDPLILVLTFGAVAWTFGRRTALLAVIYFCVLFGATFGWVGGALLRYPWLAAAVGAACCLHVRRHAAAGALLSLAAGLRIFPVFFLLPLLARAAFRLLRRRRAGKPWSAALPARDRRLLAGAAVAGAVLFLATGLLPRGFTGWVELRANLEQHTRNISPNVVGITDALAHRWSGGGQVTPEEFESLKERRERIHRAQLGFVFLPLLLAVAWASRRCRDLQALALGAPLLLSAVGLAAYYCVFLLVLLLARRRSTGHLALLFATEWVCGALRLFEDREARIHVYRTLALAWLYLLFWSPSPGRGHHRPRPVESPSAPPSPEARPQSES